MYVEKEQKKQQQMWFIYFLFHKLLTCHKYTQKEETTHTTKTVVQK